MLNMEFTFKKIVDLNYIIRIYTNIERYQKDWITKYCKKHKINNIEKIHIITEEIKDIEENETIKYINPIIIGTLSLVLWETAIQKLVDKVGYLNIIILAIV